MIVFCNKEQTYNYLSKEHFDKKYCITLFTKKGLLRDFEHMPSLAPSEELYKKTFYKWKKLKFSSEEQEKIASGKTHTWFDLYEERFLAEMVERNDMKESLKRLENALINNENIICYCYCEDFKKCHRSLLAKYFQDKGYEVILK